MFCNSRGGRSTECTHCKASFHLFSPPALGCWWPVRGGTERDLAVAAPTGCRGQALPGKQRVAKASWGPRETLCSAAGQVSLRGSSPFAARRPSPQSPQGPKSRWRWRWRWRWRIPAQPWSTTRVPTHLRQTERVAVSFPSLRSPMSCQWHPPQINDSRCAVESQQCCCQLPAVDVDFALLSYSAAE